MKGIGYRDVETYVRALISERFGEMSEDVKGGDKNQIEVAQGASSPSPVQTQTNQNNKRK